MAERGPDGLYHHHEQVLDFGSHQLANVRIEDVTFDGFVRFAGCTFTGGVTFGSCTFAGPVIFAGATIGGSIAFGKCRFSDEVSFAVTEFNSLNITLSEFDAPATLRLPEADVNMYRVTFAGHAELTGPARRLNLHEIFFRGGAGLRLSNSTVVTLTDVEFGATSSLGFERHLVDAAGPRLLSVAGTDLSCLSVFSTDLRFCTFAEAHNLDGFGVDSLAAFQWSPSGARTRRRVLWDEIRLRTHSHPPHAAWQELTRKEDAPERSRDELPQSAVEVASSYRALRKAREDAKDEPGAADFYYGEMEMRRISRRIELLDAARRRAWAECATAATEHTLLWLYWAVSGYGLRAWRALTALIVVLLGASVIFRYAGFPGDTHTYAASLRFAIQSAMSLVRGTDETLTPTGEWVALALRLLGPLLFGLALLALRGRVRR